MPADGRGSPAGSAADASVRQAVMAALSPDASLASQASPASPASSASSASSAVDDGETIAVAFSGGLDSTVLLHALSRCIAPSRVLALHVHHRLQPAADDWPAHCADIAARCGARFGSLALPDAPAGGDSIEQWARRARYRALARAVREHGASRLWTAHHADDQVETLLLRLGRGAGLSGLLGIDARRPLDGLWLERPLLALWRRQLTDYAAFHRLRWVDDPSNADHRFVRNALRHAALPALEAAMPGFRQVVLRNLEHWRTAAETLDELARADLAGAAGGDAAGSGEHDRGEGAARFGWLDRDALAGLPPARRAWAWRTWLGRMGLRAPDTARFAQMQRQLQSGASPQARVDHDGAALLRYRDRISAVPLDVLADAGRPAAAVDLQGGRGVRRVALGPGRGWLTIRPCAPNEDDAVDARWLDRDELRVAAGPLGALRQRQRPDGPSRSLKHLYQQYGVAPWLRPAMPVVLVGDDVLFSGAFGQDRSGRWRCAPSEETGTVRFAWEPDPRWLGPLRAYGYPWGRHV
ncbi:MAG: tRNA lysidine(34) synthetase TilS [Burkholderiaceae bacterium]